MVVTAVVMIRHRCHPVELAMSDWLETMGKRLLLMRMTEVPLEIGVKTRKNRGALVVSETAVQKIDAIDTAGAGVTVQMTIASQDIAERSMASAKIESQAGGNTAVDRSPAKSAHLNGTAALATTGAVGTIVVIRATLISRGMRSMSCTKRKSERSSLRLRRSQQPSCKELMCTRSLER